MNTKPKIIYAAPLSAALLFAGTATAQQPSMPDLSGWHEAAQKAAKEMTDKYGSPDGVTDTMLVWNDTGPWKQTIVYKEAVDHDFPMPHPDVLEQTINYEVPVELFDDLAAYDGSVIVERTKGVISARCDKEEANFLAINLANDIVTGKKTVEEARTFYADTIQAVMKGEKPEYTQGFVFDLPKENVGDPDKAVIETNKAQQPMQGDQTAQGGEQQTAQAQQSGTQQTGQAQMSGGEQAKQGQQAAGDNPTVGGAPMMADKPIAENASAAPNLTTLVAAAKQAGLVETLSGEGPFTVFAPTNDAFGKLPKETVDSVMKDENKDQLKDILTYHVLPEKVTVADLKKRIEEGGGKANLKTVSGTTITVRMDGDQLVIIDEAGGGAVVETADVMQSNGVVHVIDSVLMPKM